MIPLPKKEETNVLDRVELSCLAIVLCAQRMVLETTLYAAALNRPTLNHTSTLPLPK